MVYESSALSVLEDLMQQLQPILQEMDLSNTLSQFVYRIDLAETDFHEALSSGDFHNLSFMIVKREAQKVYLRNKFSK